MANSALHCNTLPPISLRRNRSPEIPSRRRSSFFREGIFRRSYFPPEKLLPQIGESFVCYADESHNKSKGDDTTGGIQLYAQIESEYTDTRGKENIRRRRRRRKRRLLTETARRYQDGWATTKDWKEIGGAWVLRPKQGRPTSIIHFVGGVFIGAAPQIIYRQFLERLSDNGALVVATTFSSGFDHFFIADEVQFKFDRCIRSFNDIESDLPIFGIGHSLGSVIHLLIGSRYAVQRNGNILMAFNNKEASLAVPLFSPFIGPIAQSFGPLLNQLTSSSNIQQGAEMAIKQLGSLSPPIMKQVLPLVEQLPPLYMDLVNGREEFIPKPEETRKLIKSYYGISRNLLIQFKDDTIDETPTLARLLSCESAISSQLDISIRSLPGDHGLPLQQVFPDVPPAVADAVNFGGEFLANLTAGTPWESMAKDAGISTGPDSTIIRARNSKQVEALVDVISSWITSNSNAKKYDEI